MKLGFFSGLGKPLSVGAGGIGQAASVSYDQQILNLTPIVYYPLWDAVGATSAIDLMGLGNGTPSNVTFGATGVAYGRTAASFNGTTSSINVYSAALNSVFDGNTGSMVVWGNSTDWANATLRALFSIFVNASNKIQIYCQSGLVTFSHIAGGTTKTKQYQVFTGLTDFMRFTMTWGGGEMVYYINDNPVSSALTGLGTFAGALSSSACMIGALLANTNVFTGSLAHAALFTRKLTAAEVIQMGYGNITRFTFLGDSISDGQDDFPAFTAPGYGRAVINNHAAGGASIAASMAGQVTASANDSANIIIIALGTNDDNAGNMTTLQATYETQVAALKVSNPNATIYALNVFPRWTDSGGGTPVDKSNIRTAIAAACTAQSITCLDTFTVPWFNAADTSDGLHPTVAGARKVTQNLLAAL